MGLLYNIALRIIIVVVFFVIIILLPNLPPKTTFPFREFEIAPTKELKGALETTSHLDGAERLLDGTVYGPECLIARKNEIYTGIHGGEIIKLTADHVTHVAKLGQPCEDISEEARCGRPLGLAFDTIGNGLIVADAYYGIWEIDLTSGKKKILISPNQELDGKEIPREAKIFNSVAVDKRGDIYWTDSSSDFTLQDLVYTSFANPSGRLFKYVRSRNVSDVLLDELYFPNGIALHPSEEFIIVAETGAMRLIKFHLKGAKAGQREVFVEGLPGMPDNLTPDADGIWVPLVMAVDSDHPSGFAMFSRFPNLRMFFARVLSLFELPFKKLNSVYPNKICQHFAHFIGHGESIKFLAPKRSTIVRVNWSGKIVGSLHGSDRSVGSISHVLEFYDHLYLGSPWNRFLARVKKPLTSGVKISNVRYEGVRLEASVKGPKVAATTETIATSTSTSKPTARKTVTTTTTTVKPTTTTTTTTTRRPTTTTTTKPTTTTKQTTSKVTVAHPSTTTTTPKPITTNTRKPIAFTKLPPSTKEHTPKSPVTTTTTTTTTTIKPPTSGSTQKRVPPKHPAPVEEKIPADAKPPKVEKLKVISKAGEHVEL